VRDENEEQPSQSRSVGESRRCHRRRTSSLAAVTEATRATLFARDRDETRKRSNHSRHSPANSDICQKPLKQPLPQTTSPAAAIGSHHRHSTMAGNDNAPRPREETHLPPAENFEGNLSGQFHEVPKSTPYPVTPLLLSETYPRMSID